MVKCDLKIVECDFCDVAGIGPLELHSVLGVLCYHFSFLIFFSFICICSGIWIKDRHLWPPTPLVTLGKYRCLSQRLSREKSLMMIFGE